MLALELLNLDVEVLQLRLRECLALERLAGEILAAGGDRVRACVSSLTRLCSNLSACSWRRFFDVTTSAMPRLTFWLSFSCSSYE